MRDTMQHVFSIREWAADVGVCYRTAHRMVHNKRLPIGVEAKQLPTGTIRIHVANKPSPPLPEIEKETVIYARINPRGQRADLDRQIELCRMFCLAKGWKIKRTVREISAALGKRQKIFKLMAQPPARLVVMTPSIISLFDFALIRQGLTHSNCELVVLDESIEREGSGYALEDLIDGISLTCRRHYGFKRGNILVESLRKLIEGNSRG